MSSSEVFKGSAVPAFNRVVPRDFRCNLVLPYMCPEHTEEEIFPVSWFGVLVYQKLDFKVKNVKCKNDKNLLIYLSFIYIYTISHFIRWKPKKLFLSFFLKKKQKQSGNCREG